MKIVSKIVFVLLILFSFLRPGFAEWDSYDKAVQFYKTAQFDSTVYYASQIKTEDSLYFYSQLLVGHAYLELDSLQKAKNIFEPLLSLNKKRFFVYNGIGLYHLLKFKSSRGVTRLVSKLFSTDDLNKAQSYFKRALSLMPDYVDARVNYNRALIASHSPDQLQIAHADLQKLSAEYPDNDDIQYYLGLCKEEMGDLNGAVEVFKALLEKNPYHSLANLSLAFIYLDMKKYDLFSKRYLQGCVGLYDHQWIEKLLNDIIDILPRAEMKMVKMFKIDGEFFLNFWISRDPNPISDENERLIEHYRRLEFARNQYPGADIAPYDDRGEIYVRYGEPDDYYHSLSAEGSLVEKETWTYNLGSDTYNFEFEKRGNVYVLVENLNKAIKDPAISSFNLKLEGDDLEFDFDSFKFFNTTEEQWYLEAYYGIDLRQIPFEFSTNKYTGELKENLVIKTRSNDPGLKTNNNIRIYSQREEQNSYYIRKVISPISLGKNTIYFQLRNTPSNRVRMVQSEVYIPVKNKSPYIISDIMISDDIHKARQGDDSLFVKNGYYIQPVPSRVFNKDNQIFCYFELYNLKPDINKEDSWKIEFTLHATKPRADLSGFTSISHAIGKENEMESTKAFVLEKSFSKPVDSVVETFDFSKMAPGVYSLEAKLTESKSKARLSESKILRLF